MFPTILFSSHPCREILAGWLGVECGSYTQISDSLHVYDSRWEDVMASTALPRVSPNHDRLALPRQESDRAFRELERRVEQMIDPETDTDTLEGWPPGTAHPSLTGTSGGPHGRSSPPPSPDGIRRPHHVSLHQSCLSTALVQMVLEQTEADQRDQ